GEAANSRFEALAASEGFLVATLQAGTEGNRWNVPITAERPDDVRYVSDVIDHVAARACTDAARVYATGFSGGARMSSLLACKLNDRIAAIAPMSGLRWPGPCDGRAIPVLTFHGLADPQNTYDGHASNRGGEWEESVPDALAGWAKHNGCDGAAKLDDPPGPLSTLAYSGCDAEVRLVRVDGLVHRWAHDEVDATAEAWKFFRAQRLPSVTH
ncbi:MAG TPA: PHB depolymerase family esterase, partial [Gammaproteobacteria bacterium]|nr:PHB depolymerase family esterase [Gammaproteobacteria bacterium]